VIWITPHSEPLHTSLDREETSLYRFLLNSKLFRMRITPMNLTLRLPNQRKLTLDRPAMMGILNVTPDSFSDGGLYHHAEAAIAHAQQMADQGADIIDVGGESTRPGSLPVDATEQIRRVVPVIRGICQQVAGVIVSIDTTQAPVAEAALDAGAVMLNDISAGRDDPRMFHLAAQAGAPLVLTHMQGSPRTMQQSPHYTDVVDEVKTFLLGRAEATIAAGVQPEQIVIDPGIGFGKNLEHNLALLAGLERLATTGFPVLLGTSRKRFMREIRCATTRDQTPPQDLIAATCATTALGVAAGVSIFRVHDVLPNRKAADLAYAVKRQGTTQKVPPMQ